MLRQVAAGAEVGVYAVRHKWPAPARYRELLAGIPFVRDLLLYPPLLLDPPMNTRTGQFTEVEQNPLDGLKLEREEWLCYPALVGRTVVFVYFHRRFMGLGLSLANLFEVASDEEIAAGPDAVYLYGVPPAALARFGDLPTVFHDDRRGRLLVAAVPLEDRFGYFGYLKKMVLTLHNVAAMDRGVMPFHGAYARLDARRRRPGHGAPHRRHRHRARARRSRRCASPARAASARCASSPTTWARWRSAPTAELLGFGTEIGAFVRLDDLQQGYAFGQLDRSIIMSPNKVNARVVLPVTTLEDVLRGYPVDFLLYANNHEAVDAGHPVVDRLDGRGGGAGRVPRGRRHEQGHDHGGRHHQQLLRQPVRPGAAPGAARGAGRRDVRGGVPGRRVRRAAAHAAGAARATSPPAPAPPPSPARPHRLERSEPIMTTLYESNETAWNLLSRGKVRDVYEYAPNQMLIVTSDRLSAFDVILPTPIPDKGVVLTQIANFWFEQTDRIIPNHLVDPDPFSTDAERRHLAGRSIVVHKAEALPVEAIVRGYLTGSGRKDYEKTRHGVRHRAAGRPRRGEPAARAHLHAVDQGRDRRPRRERLVRQDRGPASAGRWRRRCGTWRWSCTGSAPSTRCERGIIIADTKFEFGVLDGELILIDEMHDAGLVALLAGRRLRGRQEPAELRQAVRARLPGDAGLGQDGARPGAAAGGGREDLREVPRGLAPPDEVVNSRRRRPRASPGGSRRHRAARSGAARAGRPAGRPSHWDRRYASRRAHLGRRPQRARSPRRRPPAARTPLRTSPSSTSAAGTAATRGTSPAELGCRALGIDGSPAAIEAARKEHAAALRRSREAQFDVEYLASDAASLAADPERAGPYDIVFTCNVYHLLGPIGRREFAAALAAVTRPGGLLFLSTMSPRDPQHYAVGEPVSGEERSWVDKVYLHFCTAEELTRDFAAFEILDLDERGYEEPQASGQPHRHTSWFLEGRRR